MASALALGFGFLFGCGPGASEPPTPSDSNPDREVRIRTDSPLKPQREKAVIRQRVGIRTEVLSELDGVTNLIRIDLPELMSSRDRSIAFAPVLGIASEIQLGNRSYGAEGFNSHIEAEWDLVEDALHMSLSVANRGAEIAHDVMAAVCLQSAFAPTFSGSRRNTSIFSDGRAMSFSKLHGLDGYHAAGAWVEGGASIEHGGGQGRRFFGSYSALHSDHGVVFRTSEDGKWTLATLWEDAHRVFHNPAKPLDCMHSDPAFGDIEPGATATRRGWMVIHNGPPGQARDRLLGLMRAAGSK